MDIFELEGIFEQGYGFIAKKVMRDKELHYASKSIYAYICSYSGKGKDSFPSQKLMCNDLGMNKDTLAKHLKSLTDKGYIKVKKNTNVGKFANNIYSIAILPLPKSSDTVLSDTEISDAINNKLINNSINNNKKQVNRSSEINVELSFYKNKTEYMNDVRRYTEYETDIENILDYFYDKYLEKNNNFNHYRIEYDLFQTVIQNLNNMYDFIDNNFIIKGKTTFGIMLEFTESYFEYKKKHSIKNFADEKTLMWFLTTVYKEYTDVNMFFLPGKGRRYKECLSDVV